MNVQAQCGTPINTFPYVQDFEDSAAWTTGGPACTPLGLVINDWAWGHPQKNVISSAGSGQRCWIVGDTMGWQYAYGERSWVQSPCFDFATVQRPYIQFKIFWESEYKYDGANLQYSLNGGTSWTDVGSSTDPTDCMDTNWYNYTGIAGLGQYSGQLPGHGTATQTFQSLCTGTTTDGWCGNIQASYHDTTGVSSSTCQGGHGLGHWVTAKHCMPYLSGQSSVIFRFTFGAGTACNDFNGFAFDSVAIGEGTPNSANFTTTCVNTSTIQFHGIAALCPDTFQWNFGDPASGASNTITGAGNLTPTHTFSAPGTYSVTFTVKGGPCNAPGSVTKTVQVIGVDISTVSPGCTGGGGSATAVVTGNAQPYTYLWNTVPPQSTDTATGLSAGSYTVTVTTANACSATASATITASTPLTHSVATTPSQCTADNGTAKVTESGGTPGYTYIWSNGLGTTDSINNAAPGNYILSVTDSHGCTDTVHVTISSGGGLSAIISSHSDLKCFNDSTGAIQVSVTGGTAPYIYHWTSTDSGTTASQTNLSAGNYIVTVTDHSGCRDTASVTITQPNPLTHTVSTTPANCGSNNGKTVVTEGGGTPVYTYQWNNSQGTTDSLVNVTAGTYYLTITDANLCKDTVVVDINNTGGVTAVLGPVSNVSCPGGNNGSITINASNGTLPYTYHWGSVSNNNSTQGGFAAGTYVITVTDGLGCVTTVSATISQPQAFAHTVAAVPATCGMDNGSALVTETGGSPSYTYQWSNALGTADSISNAVPGSYVLSITDASGCHDTANVSISAIAPPVASLDSFDNVSCNGGNNGIIAIAVIGGTPQYTYHWGSLNTVNSTQGGFAAGNYTITVTDADGCSATVYAPITQPTAITALPVITEVSCNGGSNGSISLTASGGNGSYTYHWTNTTQTTASITNLDANTYNVTVTDIKGCTFDTSGIVNQPSPLTINFPSVINDSCSYSADGSARASASGSTPGYTYSWNNHVQQDSIGGLLPGNYSVTVTDTNNCSASATVTISSPSPIILSPVSAPVSCHNDSNGTASVSASGGTPGYTFMWNIDSTTSAITNLYPGTYTVTATDLWGCTAAASGITVVNPAALGVGASAVAQSCLSLSDGSISLTVTGGTPSFTFQWSPVSGSGSSLSGLSAGTYYYTVTDSHDCTISDSSVVAVSPPITLLASVIQPICPPLSDGSIVIAATGGKPGYTYSWNNSSQGSSNNDLAPGVYMVTVTDASGCSEADTFTLAYQEHLTVSAGITDTIQLGQSATLTAVVNTNATGISYYWSPDYHLSCTGCQTTTAGPTQTFTYYVNVNDSNGCSAEDSVTVIVNKTYNLYVPNAFTPNGDGRNDVFQIFGDSASWKYVSIKIFDRWGEKVFESDDLDFKWDGTYRGQMEEPDIFVYVLNVTYIDGHSTGTLKGSISLIR